MKKWNWRSRKSLELLDANLSWTWSFTNLRFAPLIICLLCDSKNQVLVSQIGAESKSARLSDRGGNLAIFDEFLPKPVQVRSIRNCKIVVTRPNAPPLKSTLVKQFLYRNGPNDEIDHLSPLRQNFDSSQKGNFRYKSVRGGYKGPHSKPMFFSPLILTGSGWK